MLTIKQVSNLTNVPESTLRYYEKHKLIQPLRKDNKYRYYSEADIVDIKYIAVMKDAGFTIKEMKQIIDLRRSPISNECKTSTQDFFTHLQEKLDQSIRHLKSVRSILKTLPTLPPDSVDAQIVTLFDQGGINHEN
ncbi:MerR family transcriptional regulator [Erysipelothrix sp. HDW6C]|uniref:MerR family transcriptional regulator n=1 Tax=Erysipelothrix sp. HDW6C TaxID=2714930 RepID=UPI0014094BDC|nr:MerR family transcriptional regulator [Erysipelothrix sp. HDW6C]QIK70313.1 MerR family transcriptional regulator [Erysipelothrix sp. HDW6C]